MKTTQYVVILILIFPCNKTWQLSRDIANCGLVCFSMNLENLRENWNISGKKCKCSFRPWHVALLIVKRIHPHLVKSHVHTEQFQLPFISHTYLFRQNLLTRGFTDLRMFCFWGWPLGTFARIEIFSILKYNCSCRSWCLASLIVKRTHSQKETPRVHAEQFQLPYILQTIVSYLSEPVYTGFYKLPDVLFLRMIETMHHDRIVHLYSSKWFDDYEGFPGSCSRQKSSSICNTV